MLNQSGDTRKRNQEHDTSYPRMKVKFPRWKDGDLTNWISWAKKFFHFHRTLEESKVKIALNQLDGDVIQWHN
ncbi:hypothetical protein BHM03_00051902 [Ensete ventricosum]|nr:hypothetical protein BHM03_00051902 [Ensete ventricosum]